MKIIRYSILILPMLITSLTGKTDPYSLLLRMENEGKPRTVESKLRVTRVKIKRGKEHTTIRELIRYRKYYDTGEYSSKTITRVVKPVIVRGTGVLTWSKRTGETVQWLYLPRIRTIKKIEGKDEASSFMNTDFTFEDLAGRSMGQDNLTLLDSLNVDGHFCYSVEAIPVGSSQYSKRIVYFDPDINQFRKVEFFDRKGNLFKELTLPEIEVRDRYQTVLEMTMKDLKDDSYTTIESFEVNYDTGLSDDFFTEKILIRLD